MISDLQHFLISNDTSLEALAALFAIVLFVWGLIRYFGSGINTLFKKIGQWIAQRKQNIPPVKITFVLNSRRTLWNMGSRGTEPAMQIMTSWYVTNASNVSVRILAAGITKPNPSGRTLTALVHVIERGTNWARGGMDREIQPGQTETVEATFFLDPPTQKESKPLKMKMYLIDQYGNRHKAPKIRLQYRFPSAETY